jgi:hypothetical protein
MSWLMKCSYTNVYSLLLLLLLLLRLLLLRFLAYYPYFEKINLGFEITMLCVCV